MPSQPIPGYWSSFSACRPPLHPGEGSVSALTTSMANCSRSQAYETAAVRQAFFQRDLRLVQRVQAPSTRYVSPACGCRSGSDRLGGPVANASQRVAGDKLRSCRAFQAVYKAEDKERRNDGCWPPMSAERPS